jgi:hypothetical protein
MKKTIRCGLIIAAAFLACGLTGLPCGQETQIQKAKIYLETYPLLTDTDLYCSFFILDGPLPKLKIVGAEREEIALHTDGEVVYLSGGEAEGLAKDQVLLVLEPGERVKHPLKLQSYGPFFFRRGRVKILYTEENKAAARIEKSCGAVRVNDLLIPFEIKKQLEGKDQGYIPYQTPRKVLSGTIIYLSGELNQNSYGDWVLIDIGREAGLQVGQQLTVFRPAEKGMPRRSVGNGIVADVQSKTSTLKLLATDDVVRLGDGVEIKSP